MPPIVETGTIVLVVLTTILVLFGPVPGVIRYIQRHWTTAGTISSGIERLHQLPPRVHQLAKLQKKHVFLSQSSKGILKGFDDGWDR